MLDHLDKKQLVYSFEALLNEYARPQRCPAMIRAKAYTLLAEVTNTPRRSRLSAKYVNLISPGIRYLENDTEQRLTVSEIAEMCHVSTNYFERLFKKKTGMTPREYRDTHERFEY